MIVKRVSNLKYRSDFYDIIAHRDIKVALEIGVEFGYNARDMLAHIPSIEKLYLVDPFDGSLTKKQWWTNGRLFETCQENLNPCSDRLEYIKKKSWEAYPDIEDASLDFIHIDGAHHVHGVITDLLTWWPKVKEGCVFSGHDYYAKSKKRNVLPVVNWIFKDRQIYCTNEARRENGNSPTWWVIKEGDLDFDTSVLKRKRINIPHEFYNTEEVYVELDRF